MGVFEEGLGMVRTRELGEHQTSLKPAIMVVAIRLHQI